jgi:phosphopantothenoylcysteine decarboxylase/phosphopantothenate--cysteine ligase
MNAYLARRAFEGKRVLVCVCGGVAAYKVVEIVSQLVQAGADVRVAMTPAATRFVAPLTFEAISGKPVAADLFGRQSALVPGEGGEAHVGLSDWPEVILCAPATANFMAKLAAGLADEMVSTTLLASDAPVVLAPAMHLRMWSAPATVENAAKLAARGVHFAGPVEGRLASGEVGMGRLAGEEEVLRCLRQALPGGGDMQGLKVLVSAGGTREPLDPVRYLSNRSSGIMGHALAAAAEARGAEVVLVTAAERPVPAGVRVVRVETASEMAAALRGEQGDADVLVMAAAVADSRPRHVSPVKLRKKDLPGAVALELNEDILAALRLERARPGLVRVGFAAETHDLESHAAEKLVAKGLDLIVANDVSRSDIGMGAPDNAVTILGRNGLRVDVPRASKEEVAFSVLDAVLKVREDSSQGVRVS